MDVRQLRQVLAIAQKGTFVAAAEAIGVTQSTLSKSIQRLEDECGAKLFERSADGARPTPLGRFVIGRAERIIGETAQLRREIDLINAGRIGEVRLGFGVGAGPAFAAKFNLKIAKAFPELKQRIVFDVRPRLIELLSSGQVDMIFAADGADVREHDFHTEVFATEALIAVVSPAHPLAKRAVVTADELAGFVGAALTESGEYTPRALLKLPSISGADPTTHFVSNDASVLMDTVRAGEAFTFGLASLFEEDLATGRLVKLPIEIGHYVSFIAAMTMPASHSPTLREILRVIQHTDSAISDP